MCTILNIPQSLRFFVHFNLYFPCSCCSCSSTSTSSCFFLSFLLFFLLVLILVIYFFLLLFLLLLFFFFFFLPLFNILPFPSLLTKWHLGQRLPDQRIGSWHLGSKFPSRWKWKIPEIHSKSTWKLAQKLSQKEMKLLPMMDFLFFFFAVSFAKGKNDGWIFVCRISFHQWWCPTW